MAAIVFNTRFSFSENGQYLCCCGNDGKLKIWDTSTSILKQEYTKNLHLSSPCICVVWIQTNKSNTAKKPRLSHNLQTLNDAQDVIAIGTTSGTVMLYSVGSNKILADIAAHTSRVNCLSPSKTSLFTCSDDKFIMELDLSKHKVKRKWKAGKEGVKCILALACGNRILSASCTIKLWDLKTEAVLQTFVGHSSEIFKLLEVPNKDGYFISAARGDRVISAWSAQESENNDTSIVSFILPDSVDSMHLLCGAKISTLCAVSESGVLHVFQHKMNGSIGKPLKPKMNVTIAMEDGGQKLAGIPLPIHSCFAFSADRVLLAYGNPAFLSFENLLLTEHRGENVVLLRKTKHLTAAAEFNGRNRIPNTDGEVEYLGTEAAPRIKGKQRDVPLERRLDNLALVSPSVNETLKKDNMAQLLLQGLQSKNKELIQDVLFRHEESIILATVRSLPMQSLQPLLKELTSLLQGKTFTSRAAVRWLTALLRTHAGILLSNPELSVLIEPLLTTIEAKVGNMANLLRLKGRLSLVAEQLGCDDNCDAEELPEAVVSYQDRDEDSESEGASSAESADEWDEFSGMDDSDQD